MVSWQKGAVHSAQSGVRRRQGSVQGREVWEMVRWGRWGPRRGGRAVGGRQVLGGGGGRGTMLVGWLGVAPARYAAMCGGRGAAAQGKGKIAGAGRCAAVN